MSEELTYLEYTIDKYNTVAVITKTQDEANNLYEELKDKIEINLINLNNCNINVIPSYLSKGL